MTQPTDHAQHGFELVRDHRTDLPVEQRNVTGAARIADDGPQPRLANAGDKINYAFWAAATAGARAIGGWSMAWPAEMRATGLLPRRTGDATDDRFRELQSGDGPAPDDDGPTRFATSHGRDLPGGVTGVLLAGTEESAQHNLFVPATELVAHHAGDGPPTFSTPVFDIRTPADGGAELDDDRPAGLHGHLRVAQLPAGGVLGQRGEHTPAWNLGRSTGDATGFGSWVNSGTPAGPAGQAAVRTGGGGGGGPLGAFASHEASGPLHPGDETDVHRIGRSDDGRTWNSGHLDTNALFFADAAHDGPLDFERRPYPKASELPIKVKVHLAWDDAVQHAWIGGPRPGRWRWYSSTAIRQPFIPFRPTPDGIRITTTDEPTTPFDPSAHTDRLQPGPGQPIDPARLPWEIALPSLYGQAVRRQSEGSAGQPYDGRFGGGPVDGGVTDDDLASGLFPGQSPSTAGSTIDDDFDLDRDSLDPGWQATRELTGRADRRRQHEAGGDIAARVTPPEAPSWTKAPLVWHIQSFGASDANGDWTHTNEPGAYYLGGTTHGGALFAPPEVLLDGADPDVVSDASFVLYNGHAGGNPAKLGWGVPDQSDGSFADGFWLQASGSSGTINSVQTFVTASGATRLGMHTLQGEQFIDIGGGGGTGRGLQITDSGNASFVSLKTVPSGGFFAFSDHVVPDLDGTFVCGSSSLAWRDVHSDQFQANDDGSASAPAFVFNGDGDTGIYRPGADQIGFTAGATERMRLTSSALKPQGNGTDLGAASDAWGDGYFSGKLTVGGLIDPTGLVLSEQSSQPHTTTAGELGLWVTDDAAQRLIAEDDAGVEHVLAGPRKSSVTIASGGITLPDFLPDWAWLELSPEGGLADNLDVITGGADAWAGQKIILSATGNTITLRTKSVGGETGANILLEGDNSANNITLAGPDDRVALMRDASGDWLRLFDSGNTV